MKDSHRRGIYLLPNLITTASLLLGFYAVICALHDDFSKSAYLILICIVLDGLDGRAARMLGIASRFGAQMDSLTDAVVFGVSPAIIAYLWLNSITELVGLWERVAWLVAFFYVVSTVLRLARFNVQSSSDDKHIFRGLPSPAAAALVLSLIWVCYDWNYVGMPVVWIMLIVLTLSGLAMVSNLSYYNLKGENFKHRISVIASLLIAAFLIIAAIDLPRFLLALSLIYGVSGPIMYIVRWYRKSRHTEKQSLHKPPPLP